MKFEKPTPFMGGRMSHDLYNSECSEQTMYGYADYGETNKRTLELGDITGVKKLYS